jgi:hypothetical protein
MLLLGLTLVLTLFYTRRAGFGERSCMSEKKPSLWLRIVAIAIFAYIYIPIIILIIFSFNSQSQRSMGRIYSALVLRVVPGSRGDNRSSKLTHYCNCIHDRVNRNRHACRIGVTAIPISWIHIFRIDPLYPGDYPEVVMGISLLAFSH